ncbi:MAG TPA: terminase family protein [Patescibacteria group bacterium]|nr:terminase family protein [Patescibacteria group bacterium]
MPDEISQDDIAFHFKCASDFPFFCEKVLSLEMTGYHQEICSLPGLHKYLCIIMPRGHGKTQIFSIAFPLWKLFTEKDKEICLVSSTIDQSRKIFSKMQYVLETNPFFKSLLPTDRRSPGGGSWNSSQITTTNHNLFYNKPFNSSARGMQPNYIIYDDLLRDVEDMTVAKETYWSVFYPAGQAVNCRHIIVGTPIGLDDLYADLQKKEGKGWHVYKRSAVSEDEKGNWIKPLWPQRFTLERLYEMRESMNPTRFEREMMCRPRPVGDVLFPQEMILNATDDNLEFSSEVKGISYVGADFAMSTKSSGDFNVFVVVDDQPGEVYKKKTDKGIVEINDPVIVRTAMRFRGNMGQTEKIKSLYDQYHCARAIGDNSGVGAKFVKELQDEQVFVDAQDFQPAKRNMLLMGLRGLLEKNRLVIPSGPESSYFTDILIRELSGFRLTKNNMTGHESWKSNLDHDDTVMALAMAVKHASNPKTQMEDLVFVA